MLNGDGNENGIKINRCDQQRNKLHVQHTFFSNQQKIKCARAALFFVFLCRCFAQLQRCFVGLNRQTSQLHVFLMEELSYVLTQYFVSCVHVRFYFSLPLHFHLAGRQHFSLSHHCFEFSCFSSYKIRLFCFQSLALVLSLLSM